MWAEMAQAQVINAVAGKAVLLEGGVSALQPVITPDITITRFDTVPVWVIYMDSVRLYAAHPEYDIRLEVAAGWKINYGWKAEWYDQDGKKFNPENIIMDRPRKPRPNPFKE